MMTKGIQNSSSRGEMPDGEASIERELPRVLFAAPRSGGGKTTVVCGMLAAFRRLGLSPAAFKCGPDYIDPMFHRTVLETPSFNLDLFFTSEQRTRSLLVQNAEDADVAILEGVMGFYDGLDGTAAVASAYHLARTTDTPVVLVIDAKGAALSLAATVKGFLDFRPDSHIAAVLLNRASEGTYRMVAPLIEQECGIPVIGYLPADERFSLESRHLGLVTAAEVDDLRAKMELVADALLEHVDFDALRALASSAPRICAAPFSVEPVCAPDEAPVVAVAYDKAFCFYYEENFRLLEQLGARIERFSPLTDAAVPDDADAIYLGGGYPELYAGLLADNVPMRDSIARACAAGMPVFAECGGFLCLQRSLADLEGTAHPMAGVLPARAAYTGHLTRFGYVTLTAQEDNLLMERGETVPAHEFHYYDSDGNGDACIASKPHSQRSWPCFVAQGNTLAGFPHLYFPAKPDIARRFVEAARAFQATRTDAMRTNGETRRSRGRNDVHDR